MKETKSDLYPHQEEAMSELEAMRTGVVDYTPGTGKTESNSDRALHKAGQKLVDGLIAKHGKEGAQRILSQRLEQAKRKQVMQVSPLWQAVRTGLGPTQHELNQHNSDLELQKALRINMLKQRLQANPELLDEMKELVCVEELAEVMSVFDEIEPQPQSSSDRATMQVKVGDESFEPTSEDLDQIKETFEQASDENYALPVGNDDETPSSDEDDFDIDALDIPEVDIEYQEDDGNSDCGDSCTI